MTDRENGRLFGGALSVTPSDTALVNCSAIYVTDGGGATVNIALSIDGSTTPVTFVGVHTGDTLPIRLRQGRIMATNTTATNLLLLQ